MSLPLHDAGGGIAIKAEFLEVLGGGQKARYDRDRPEAERRLTMGAQTYTITRIQIEGFRSIKSQVVELDRLNVLIGPNGAGKSNLLSFLRMIAMLRTQSLKLFMNLTGGAAALLHRGPKITPVMSFAIEATREDGQASGYSARLAHAAGDTLIFVDEAVRARKANAQPWTEVSLGAGHVDSKLEAEAAANRWPAAVVRGWVSRINFFHFHDTSRESPLRQHRQSEEDDYLRSDGRNLAPYLYRLATSSDESDRAALQRIQTLVTRIAPFVKTLDPTLVNPGQPQTSAIRLDWTDQNDDRWGVHVLSDGTLRAIALFTALAQPVERLPSFISIDEPELGLHPAAIALLVDLMRSVSHRCQILVATQSPALLDHFKPDEVIVVEAPEGATEFKRQDPESLAGWLEDYSLSELYDKNVLGGRP